MTATICRPSCITKPALTPRPTANVRPILAMSTT
jgi:hypothetical protein